MEVDRRNHDASCLPKQSQKHSQKPKSLLHLQLLQLLRAHLQTSCHQSLHLAAQMCAGMDCAGGLRDHHC